MNVRALISAFTISQLLSACAVGEETHNRLATSPCPVASGDAHFFPHVTFWDDGIGDQDQPENPPFSLYLAAMNEPPLACGNDGNTVAFRLLWVGDKPVSIRATRHGRTATLTVVELDGKEGQAPGPVSRRFTRPMLPVEWNHLMDAVNGKHSPLPNVVNAGAALWVLEGLMNEKYVLFEGVGDDMNRSAMGFFDVAGLPVPAGMLR